MSENQRPNPAPLPSSHRETYWTPGRLELYHWLSLQAPEVASIYAGALHMLESDYPIPGREHFVAHATRELWNRVIDLVLGLDGSPRTSDRFQRIADKWKVEEEHSSSESKIELPFSIFKLIDDNVRQHKSSPTQRQKIAQVLREMIGSTVPESELESEAKVLYDRHNSIVGAAHPAIKTRELSWEEIAGAFAYIESIVRATVRPSTSLRSDLDAILDQVNG